MKMHNTLGRNDAGSRESASVENSLPEELGPDSLPLSSSRPLVANTLAGGALLLPAALDLIGALRAQGGY